MPSPIVARKPARGIRRTIGTAPARKATTTADVIGRLLALSLCASNHLISLRDRALGFAGAFRRSELVALDDGDEAGRQAAPAHPSALSETPGLR